MSNTFRPAYKKHMVISAPPGFFAVDWLFDPKDENPPQHRLEPVQAWIVSIYEDRDNPRTITVCDPVIHEAKSSFFEGAVLYPDGRVVIPGKGSFRSLEDYAAHKQEGWHNNYTAIARKQEELASGGLDGLTKEQERGNVERDRS
jgi:hypothetical protein